jgi:hypothetical protein
MGIHGYIIQRYLDSYMLRRRFYLFFLYYFSDVRQYLDLMYATQTRHHSREEDFSLKEYIEKWQYDPISNSSLQTDERRVFGEI